jgi:hypothetical protein
MGMTQRVEKLAYIDFQEAAYPAPHGLLREALSLTQPCQVEVLVQGGQSLLRHLFRQLCYPSLSRRHEFGVRCLRHVSLQRSDNSTPRFPPPGPRGASSPASTVLSGRYDFLPPISPRFVSFAWRYHSSARVSPARGRALPWAGIPELVTRYLQPGFCQWKRQDLLRSWGTPLVLLPCSPTPAGPTHQAIMMRQRGPRTDHDEGSCIRPFGAQSHGFGTGCLRFAGRVAPTPRKTRFRLLAKLFRTGLVTRRVPSKGFKVYPTSILLSQVQRSARPGVFLIDAGVETAGAPFPRRLSAVSIPPISIAEPDKGEQRFRSGRFALPTGPSRIPCSTGSPCVKGDSPILATKLRSVPAKIGTVPLRPGGMRFGNSPAVSAHTTILSGHFFAPPEKYRFPL